MKYNCVWDAIIFLMNLSKCIMLVVCYNGTWLSEVGRLMFLTVPDRMWWPNRLDHLLPVWKVGDSDPSRVKIMTYKIDTYLAAQH